MNYKNLLTNLLTKRNIIIAVVLILAIAIPVSVKLVQQQQQLKSKAVGNANVNFIGATPCASPSTICTSSPTIQLQLTSPFGQ